MHHKNIINNYCLKVNARVAFYVETSDKGLVASNISLDSKSKTTSRKSGKNLSDKTIIILFVFLFIIQVIILVKEFICSTN